MTQSDARLGQVGNKDGNKESCWGLVVTIVERTAQTVAGMQKVERDIIKRLEAAGAQRPRFEWNRGRSLAEIPLTTVRMEVAVGARRVEVEWPREQLADSAGGLESTDVRQEIRRIVAELSEAA